MVRRSLHALLNNILIPVPELLCWVDQHRWLAHSHHHRGLLFRPVHICSRCYWIGRSLCHHTLEDIPDISGSLDLHDSAEYLWLPHPEPLE